MIFERGEVFLIDSRKVNVGMIQIAFWEGWSSVGENMAILARLGLAILPLTVQVVYMSVTSHLWLVGNGQA